MYENISLDTLKAWRDDSKVFMDHPRIPKITLKAFPDYPGRDWYRQNYAELCAEIERRVSK